MSARDSTIRGIVAYLIIAFGMSWFLWCFPLLFGLTLRSPSYFLFLLFGAFSPAIAAIIVRKWITREGFADAGLRLNFVNNKRYYLIGWLLPLLVVAIILLLAVIFRISSPDFSLQRAINALGSIQNPLEAVPRPIRFPVVGVLQALLTAIIATPLLWGEEFGWRGYLQIRLMARRPLLAAIITGVIWGIWHYPINQQGYNYPDNRILGLFIFPVFTVLLSIILGWLRLKTGSIWSASLAHSATNTIGGGLTILLFMGAPNWIFVGYAGILSWIPLGALCAWIILTGQLAPIKRR
jgi:membrane protease YdiL (CAAX protease family)